MQLGQLQTIEPDIIGLGFQILAISPDPPMKLNASAQQHGLKYRLLSDRDRSVSKAFGIAFGTAPRILPVPSVFIIGKDARIRFQYVDPNYKVRIDPDLLLAAVKSVAKLE